MKYTHLVFSAFLILSCSDAGKDAVVISQNFSVNKFSEDLTEKLFLEEMNSLVSAAIELEEKTEQCEDGVGEEQIEDYRGLWLEAMMSFHRVHPHLKSGVLTLDFLEQDVLIDRIYRGTFGASACEIQVKVVDQRSLGSVNVRILGLSALETALFGSLTSENTCGRGSANYERVESWLLDSSEQDKMIDLCGYVNKAAGDLASKALEQVNRASELSEDVGVQALYSESALQKIYDSLSQFVQDEFMKVKIHQPLGVSNCLTLTCPSSVEHRESGYSFMALKSNLLGLEKILRGFGEQESGLGHYLRINNHDNLVDEVYELINQGVSLLNELDGSGESFFEASERLSSEEGKENCKNTTLENKLEPVCALTDLAIQLSTIINVDLKAALAVSSTQIIEGDSD